MSQSKLCLMKHFVFIVTTRWNPRPWWCVMVTFRVPGEHHHPGHQWQRPQLERRALPRQRGGDEPHGHGRPVGESRPTLVWAARWQLDLELDFDLVCSFAPKLLKFEAENNEAHKEHGA